MNGRADGDLTNEDLINPGTEEELSRAEAYVRKAIAEVRSGWSDAEASRRLVGPGVVPADVVRASAVSILGHPDDRKECD